MTLRTLFLNCTLKTSPQVSHTSALLQKAAHFFKKEGFACEEIRIVDHHIPCGMAPRMSDDDAWPDIFAKVMASEVLVIGTPIWLGERSSIASKVIERLYGSSGETNAAGQYIYYNKVGGVIATGNEDGAKASSASLLYALQHIGFTIPPQADAYWVGEAGPGPSYIEAGQDNAFTQRNTRFMAYNLIHFARKLAASAIPAEGNLRDESARGGKPGAAVKG